MSALSKSQRQDVAGLLAVCREFNVEAVVIGATAYRLLFEESQRYTLDIDLALALDLDDWARFGKALVEKGWRPSTTQEPRWTTPGGNRFDLLPAGPALRHAGRLVWPRTGMVMSLVGFDQVFRRAIVQDVGGGVYVKVVPPAVLALLKIVSFMENPEIRAKDLDDVKGLFRWYEHASDRIFSDAVIQADLSDVEFASAFLLGLDLRDIADDRERRSVELFLHRVMDSTDAPVPPADEEWTARQVFQFQQQLRAFAQAFRRAAS